MHDHLTKKELRSGFVFDGQRVPLVNPQRGIFKPRSMRYLLSIRTVFPRPGGRVWYDDQREVHRQIFEGDDAIDYAFMGFRKLLTNWYGKKGPFRIGSQHSSYA